MAYKYSGTFAITAPASITLTGPTGTLNVGDTVNITWTTTGTVGNVKIELYYSTSWSGTIVNSTANDGTFSWTIQSGQLSGTSSLYKLKIFETDGAPVDYSNFLTIIAEIRKTPSDSAQFTEVVTQVDPDDTWKTVKQPTDSIQFSDDDVNFDDPPRKWKHIKSPTDSIQFSEDDVLDDKRIYKKIRTPDDSASFSEAIVPLAKRVKVPADSASFTELVDGDRTHWKHFADQSDGVQFDEDVGDALKRPRSLSESTGFTEVVQGIPGKWKHLKYDSTSFNEQVNNWIKSTFNIGNGITFPPETVLGVPSRWKHLKDDSAAFTEIVDPDTRKWKHLKDQSDSIQFSTDEVIRTITEWHHITPTDSIQFSDDDTDYDTRTWKHLHPQSDSITFPEETVLGVPRIWKHIKDQDDSIGFSELDTNGELSMDNWYITEWHRFYYDSTAITESTMDDWYITQWHRFYEDNIAFSDEQVDHEIKTWKHIIDDVIAFTESVSDIFGEAPADATQFIESVTTAIFKSCKVRKFSDTSTETFGTFRKSGWLSSTDADGNANTIRRLNVEYNSADPLDFRIYIDGDDTNHAFLTSFPAAIGVETTNKSIRVGKRAKNFMLEIATVESTNSNVKIEDIEVEIDGKI